jgi:hypothetical protein
MNICMKKQSIQLKAFGEYLKDKPLSRLLHQARKESLKRIESHESSIDMTRNRVPQKRTGTR